MTIESLRWKKYPVLNDGFICLIDVMGGDASITQAARVSYGNDLREYETVACKLCNGTGVRRGGPGSDEYTCLCVAEAKKQSTKKDRHLIRYLLNHGHTSPFEMVELKFLVRVPMDCWRQWIRHRTANVNEYSTRYTEAIDSQQTTSPQEWRLQATDNKQGSSGYIEEGLSLFTEPDNTLTGMGLSEYEKEFHAIARNVYQLRLDAGVAKEQARKDLPLSTYTEAYWKCDLHNIFNFLRLRMDSHAQYEIRMYANAMYEIVKQVCPVACEAFEDYVLHAKKFSRMEMELLRQMLQVTKDKQRICNGEEIGYDTLCVEKPSSMTDREWKEFLTKLS